MAAARRPITTILALGFLLAVVVGIGSYGYEGSLDGFAYLVGLAIAAGLVLGLIGFLARKSKRPMRWDIGLVVITLFLIWTNRGRNSSRRMIFVVSRQSYVLVALQNARQF